MGKRKDLGILVGSVAPLAIAAMSQVHSRPPAPVAPPLVVVQTVAAPQPAQAAAVAVAATPLPPPQPTPAASADCLQRFQSVGLPYQRGDDAAANETLVCRRGYALGFDAVTHDPNWVMELLTPAELKGSASRTNQFKQDPLVHGQDANNSDYAKSGYDRGHQAPAGDAKFSQAVMNDSFFFTNMAPQIGIGFNRGAWKYLEETVRAWVTCGGHNRVYVITGPIYAGSKPPTIGTDKVFVPAQFFKIVYDPDSNRAVGFVLPNAKIGSRLDDLQAHVKPIEYIETETGLAFFRALGLRTQTQLKVQAGTAWAHVATCSGDTGD